MTTKNSIDAAPARMNSDDDAAPVETTKFDDDAVALAKTISDHDAAPPARALLTSASRRCMVLTNSEFMR